MRSLNVVACVALASRASAYIAPSARAVRAPPRPHLAAARPPAPRRPAVVVAAATPVDEPEAPAELAAEFWPEAPAALATEFWRNNWARLAILVCAAVYGTNFSAVKTLDAAVAPSLSASLRFGLASLAALPIVFDALRDRPEGDEIPMPRALALGAAEIGCVNALGYICQSVGLETVHASLSALDPACVNYDLVVKLCEAIFGGDASATAKRVFETVKDDAEGAILVFMPGLAEITETVTKLRASAALEGRATIFALHSQLSTAEQAAIFQRARKGTRKIVVSTNIAETSITIDDVVYVVDCARVKENRYDADRGLATLEEVFVSRAAARQRRGRAGRVRSGVAFHLVTREAHDAEFDAYPQPEILRTSLEDLVLQILVLDLGDPKVFLNKAVSPPTAAAVDRAIELLAGIDALEPFAEDRKVPKVAALTALGFHLASLPVEPRVGKLLLVGAMRVRRRPSFRFRIAR